MSISIEHTDHLGARLALAQIADALGVPVLALYDPALMPAEIAGAAELISLFLRLENEAARIALLTAARLAASAQV